MKNKSLQLLILTFLFLLLGFGLHQHAFSHSLTESYIDPYPNWFIGGFSLWYQDGEKALGSPNNEFALIYQDYGNGYLTLDFGSNQEIVDGTGLDFTIYAQGGEYIVRIGNDLSSPFKIFENETGGVIFISNKSLDLSGTDLDSVRYVQVECTGATVKLDAIEALNYNHPTLETDPPQITGPEDISISNQTSVEVSWEVNDLHPWNYSIFIDENTVEHGFWTDSPISYTVDLVNKNESFEITLVLDDIFGNRAEDTVTIEIGSPSNSSNFPLIPILGGFLLISILRKKKLKKLG